MKVLCVAIVIASAAFLLIIVGEFLLELKIFGVKIDRVINERRTKISLIFFSFTITFFSFTYFFLMARILEYVYF